MFNKSRPTKRATIYIRVSNQVPSHTALRSVDAQRHACQRRASELGAEVVSEYVEHGPASSELSKRVILLTMLADIDRRRDIDHVITYDQARLAHGASVYVRIMHAIEMTGADIAIAVISETNPSQEVN